MSAYLFFLCMRQGRSWLIRGRICTLIVYHAENNAKDCLM